jgi:hypothetical protein
MQLAGTGFFVCVRAKPRECEFTVSRKAAMWASLIETPLSWVRQKEVSMPKAQSTPGKALLDPADGTAIIIDHHSQISLGTQWIDAVMLRSNCALVAQAAREFKVSTILMTVAENGFSEPIYEEIRSVPEGRTRL